MTDFVLEHHFKQMTQEKMNKVFDQTENYANFLKQPLTLGIFVPCDEDGNVLIKPRSYNTYLSGFIKHESTLWVRECDIYIKAKNRVLFKGVSSAEVRVYSLSLSNEDTHINVINGVVEQLIDRLDLELTPTAIKQIGL